MSSSGTFRLLVVAGEASGDQHAASLVHELGRFLPSMEVFGIGGSRLRSAGADLLYDSSEMAVVGFAEVARRIRFFRTALDRIVSEAQHRRPDAALLVDYPGFNLRLAARLKELGIRVIWYIAPQVWAWKEGRVRQLREYVDDLIVLFPFEIDYFRGHGIEAAYFGHPLFEHLRERSEEIEAKSRALKEGDSRPIVTYLPGSRTQEIARHMPLVIGTIRELGGDYRHVIPIAETIDRSTVERLLPDDEPIELVGDAMVALRAASAGVVKSGTSTLNAVAAGVPFSTIYRTSLPTYVIARALARTPFLAMPNILLGRGAIRELIQREATVASIARETRRLLDTGEYRSRVLADLAEVRAMLDRENVMGETARWIAGKVKSWK